MPLPKFSVHHPIFTTMITLIVVILGAVSLSRLRTDLLPEIELPTLSVRTDYEGANPEVVERLITRIVEEIIATVPGVEEVSSTSSEGRSNVSVTFGWGTNIDTAAVDVKSTIEDEINELPDDINSPRISKFDVNSYPVVVLGVTSELDPVELTDLIENQLRFRFSRIPGVAQVDTWGSYSRELRIELIPEKIKSFNISLDEILTAVREANLDLPAGKIEQGRYEISLRAPSEFASLQEVKDTVVSLKNGSPVTIGDLAEIHDTYERKSRIIRVNQGLGIRVAIRKQADANTVEVAQGILEEIEHMNRDYPQINVTPIQNQGNFIERSIANVSRSVLYGGFLSVAVLLFFLRNIRSTVVIALSIPISVVATFALVYFGGYTLNLMTLGGLALGVGMMVDSSVVVLENIFRRQDEENESAIDASINGTNEVAGAIIASTLTTLVIFLPMAFIRGVSGLLFQELALVVVFSLSCSLIVSLSLVPMLASRLLHSPDQQHRDRGPFAEKLAQTSDRFFVKLNQEYLNLLNKALSRKIPTVILSIVLLGFSCLLAPKLGSEFMPPSDEGEVRVTGEMEVGTRLDLVDIQGKIMEEIVFPAVPEMQSSVTTIGSSFRSGGSTNADISISLVPATQRERSNTEVARDLRKRLEGVIPGMEIRIRAPQGQFLLERILGGDEGITVEILGYDLDVLGALSDRIVEKLADVPGITDVNPSKEDGVPQEEIRIDRAKAASLGISVRDVSRFIETAVAGSTAGEYRRQGLSYPIRVQLKDAERRSLEEILDLTLTTPDGTNVILRNIVSVNSSSGPLEITRKDQQRVLTVQANVAGRDNGSVARDILKILESLPRPEGVEMRLAGNYEEQEESFREMILSLFLALIFVYMVLACQYESLVNPLIVMASVPMAAIGVLVTLFLTDTTLNLQSYIGCIMLGGIVVNNAILLVDQSNQLLLKGMPLHEAVIEAGRRRLRPILMTTLTTMLALMPLAFGVGEGAEAQAPLARAVVGGLACSTLITLVLIPTLFSLVHKQKEKAA
ncbi:efflux RND transporter permease subunit [Kiritimatiellaeota bacterium B1221]|nr:efflux RND transporter permease subunit [Kiritimatiellaeota bacterium B1221]